jgi:peptide/nickel transport system substrate-binding protein
MYDSLVGFDLKKGGVGPGVAERWELSPDGLTWTFFIRPGQTFHNGDKLTAHDVKFSLERQMGPGSLASAAASMRRTIKSIEVIDDLTVRVNTTSPQIGLPAGLSRAVAPEGAIMPKAYIEKVGEEEFRKKPIGSGPWKFVRNVPGDRIEFTAVTTPHWRGKPHFKDLHLLLVPEESTRVAMVRTGEAAIASIGPETMLGATRAGLEVLSVPGTMQAVFQFWGTWKPEFKDSPIAKPRVRQALSLAIDRKQVIEHVMNGKAQLPYPFATFAYTDYFSADRWQKWAAEAYRYDPALAKKMLAEEGYPNGFELKFANTALPGTQFMVDIGTAIADMWTKIGVKVTLKQYEWGAFAPMERGDQAGLVGWASMYRTAGRPDAPWRYDGAFSPESTQRLLGDKDNCGETCQDFVKTNRALLSELDRVKRTALTDRMVEIVANSWTVMPILEGKGYYAINTKKVGQFQAIAGRHELGDVFERIPRPEEKPWKK